MNRCLQEIIEHEHCCYLSNASDKSSASQTWTQQIRDSSFKQLSPKISSYAITHYGDLQLITYFTHLQNMMLLQKLSFINKYCVNLSI